MIKRMFLPVVFSAVFFAAAAIAKEDGFPKMPQEAPSEKQCRVQVGNRPAPYADNIAFQKERAREGLDAKGGENEESIAKDSAEKCAMFNKGGLKDLQAAVYYTTHPGVYYSPITVSTFGSSVELHDGSIWAINTYDANKTLNWLPSDTVVITQNNHWFSNFSYLLNNQNTAVSVEANLTLGPIYNGIHTHWIVSIDKNQRIVQLEDGSVWQMCLSDYYIFRHWLVNDTVIMGVNSGWHANTNPNILINVNMLNHSRGICIH